MRVFVTGATGVVGRRLLPLLLERGHSVTGAARTLAKRAALERAAASAIELDLLDPEAVRRAVVGHDAVINLATHIPPSSRAFLPGAWRENDRLRIHASTNLANAALVAGCERLIQESVSLIYPDSGESWIRETDPIDPPAYARSVRVAESQAERFSGSGRVGVVLRFALFYGPDSGHTVDTIAFVRKGIAPTFGRADGYISSLSTDDAAMAVLAALGVGPGTYNVADDEPVRRREYFDTLAQALDVSPPKLPPAWMKYLGGSLAGTVARSQRVSNARFKREASWAPRLSSVREGWPFVCRSLQSGEARGQ